MHEYRAGVLVHEREDRADMVYMGVGNKDLRYLQSESLHSKRDTDRFVPRVDEDARARFFIADYIAVLLELADSDHLHYHLRLLALVFHPATQELDEQAGRCPGGPLRGVGVLGVGIVGGTGNLQMCPGIVNELLEKSTGGECPAVPTPGGFNVGGVAPFFFGVFGEKGGGGG